MKQIYPLAMVPYKHSGSASNKTIRSLWYRTNRVVVPVSNFSDCHCNINLDSTHAMLDPEHSAPSTDHRKERLVNGSFISTAWHHAEQASICLLSLYRFLLSLSLSRQPNTYFFFLSISTQMSEPNSLKK